MNSPVIVNLTQPPKLPAYRDPSTGFLRIWCVHCRCWHCHGRGEGHRQAHCHRADSPYLAWGYYLVDVGIFRREEWDRRGNRKQIGKR